MADFKIIKVDRFDSKAIRHAFDDIIKQTFNNRVCLFTGIIFNTKFFKTNFFKTNFLRRIF